MNDSTGDADEQVGPNLRKPRRINVEKLSLRDILRSMTASQYAGLCGSIATLATCAYFVGRWTQAVDSASAIGLLQLDLKYHERDLASSNKEVEALKTHAERLEGQLKDAKSETAWNLEKAFEQLRDDVRQIALGRGTSPNAIPQARDATAIVSFRRQAWGGVGLDDYWVRIAVTVDGQSFRSGGKRMHKDPGDIAATEACQFRVPADGSARIVIRTEISADGGNWMEFGPGGSVPSATLQELIRSGQTQHSVVSLGAKDVDSGISNGPVFREYALELQITR